MTMKRLKPWLDDWNRSIGELLLENTHLSMWELVRRSANRFPDHPAIVEEDHILTYRMMQEAVLRSAYQLHHLGISKGTKVAYLFGLSREWAIVHYALLRLGAVIVPLNSMYESGELESVLERSKARFLITVNRVASIQQTNKFLTISPDFFDVDRHSNKLPDLHTSILLETVGAGYRLLKNSDHDRVFGVVDGPLASPLSPVSGGDPASIYFTSGSTASPKPALSAHRGHTGAATCLVGALGLDENDRWLAYTPTFHVSGAVWALLMPHTAGAASYFVPFDPVKALATIERERITTMGAFDIHFTRMMSVPQFKTTDLSSVRKATIGVTESFLKRIEPSWNFERIVFNYGSTESGGVAALSPYGQPNDEIRRAANGVALPGIDLVIKDPETRVNVPIGTAGEICFRGWCRFLEYIDMPEETAVCIDDDGYFHSGDYGWLDNDGNVYFRGRYKQMVKTGGENVAEREVEMFIESTFSEISHVEVVGVPDKEWGEAVAVFVEYKEGATSLSTLEFREFCRGKIASFKIPKYVITVATGYEWPALGSGRIDKHVLRELAAKFTMAGIAEDSFTDRH